MGTLHFVPLTVRWEWGMGPRELPPRQDVDHHLDGVGYISANGGAISPYTPVSTVGSLELCSSRVVFRWLWSSPVTLKCRKSLQQAIGFMEENLRAIDCESGGNEWVMDGIGEGRCKKRVECMEDYLPEEMEAREEILSAYETRDAGHQSSCTSSPEFECLARPRVPRLAELLVICALARGVKRKNAHRELHQEPAPVHL